MINTGKMPDLSGKEQKALEFVAEQTPVGAIYGRKKGKGGVAGLEGILKGEQGWDDVLRQSEARVLEPRSMPRVFVSV
jgi:hypothetical protein